MKGAHFSVPLFLSQIEILRITFVRIINVMGIYEYVSEYSVLEREVACP